MKTKKLLNETNSWIFILALLAVLAVFAIISEVFLHTRLDLTEDKQFSLSESSVKTLGNLPDIITVKAVISSELPTQFIQVKTRVKDLLEEFKARSNGKLELQFIDPGTDEEKKKQVMQWGIQEVTLQEQSQQGIEMKKGFFGLAITYGDNKEVFPVLQNLDNFEYDLITKIKKLIGQTKTVGVFEGSEGSKFSFAIPGNPPQVRSGFAENFPSFKNELEKVYTVETVNLDQRVGGNIDMLLVLSPSSITEVQKFWLDQYIMAGKSVLFLAPGTQVNLQMGIQAMPTYSSIDNLLSHYGIAVNKNVIVEDRYFERVPFGNSIFPTPYPYWIIVEQKSMGLSAITKNLGKISLPWPSSLSIDSSKLGQGKTVEVLAQSTPGSWEESGQLNLMPRDLREYRPINQKSHPLIALVTGKFNSYYSQNPLDSTVQVSPDSILRQSLAESRILVVGNALFGTDFYVGLMRAVPNISLLLNSIDYLAQDADLIKIRGRSYNNKPIEAEYTEKKIPIVLTNMLIVPVLLLGIGIFMVVNRRKKQG